MWLLVTRQPLPDAPYWLGRRWLAAFDAVAWPGLWMVMLERVPTPTGIVVPVLTTLAGLGAAARLRRAVLANHRYQFTTWRWGRPILAVLALGLVLRVLLAP
jgi:hypothetical protein